MHLFLANIFSALKNLCRDGKWGLFTVIFLDFTGLFMVLPIFTPLIMNHSNLMLSSGTVDSTRTFIIGSLGTCFGLAQFFGAPFLGALSDHQGRKKALLIALCVGFLGYLIAAIAMWQKLIFLLYFSRLLLGFASGADAVLFATASSISKNPQEQSAYFGYLVGAATLGCIIGPLLGSQLTNHTISPLFALQTPFCFMAILVLANFLFLKKFFVEEQSTAKQMKSVSIFTGLNNIALIFSNRKILFLLLAYFLFVCSTESSFISVPIFTYKKFHVDSIWIGELFSIQNIVSGIAIFALNGYLSKRYTAAQIFCANIFLLAIFYFLLLFPTSKIYVLMIYATSSIFMSFVWAYTNSLIASTVDEMEKGKIMGITQSLLSMAIMLGPMLVGFIAGKNARFAVALSGLYASGALISYFFYAKKIKKQSIF